MAEFDSQMTFCYTTDLEEASRFYGELLGLPMVLDQGGCRIFRSAPAAYIGFCRKAEAPEPGAVILTLVTEDVDGWYDRLREAGVAFEKEPALNPEYNIYHCFLRDPAGYLVEIQRFEDPRWEG